MTLADRTQLLSLSWRSERKKENLMFIYSMIEIYSTLFHSPSSLSMDERHEKIIPHNIFPLSISTLCFIALTWFYIHSIPLSFFLFLDVFLYYHFILPLLQLWYWKLLDYEFHWCWMTCEIKLNGLQISLLFSNLNYALYRHRMQ